MAVKKMMEVLLDRIQELQDEIHEKETQINVLRGYKEENQKLRDEIKCLKLDEETSQSVIKDQAEVIKNLINGVACKSS